MRPVSLSRHAVHRALRAACLAGMTLAVPPFARADAPPATEPPVQPGSQAQPQLQIPTEPEAEYALPTRLDRIGRVLAPVSVNGQGPFRFILDTGANRSVLSPKLAAQLGLTPAADDAISVQGVTGSAVLPAVMIDSLQAGDLLLVRRQRVPVLAQTVLIDADGILGIDGLVDARVDIDFGADRVVISKARGQTNSSGMLKIPVVIRHGGLLRASGMVGRQRVVAIIDTGAERSLGNPALRRLLQSATSTTTDTVTTTVMGATPDLAEGTPIVVSSIRVGGVDLRSLEVTFGDLNVFRVWNLENEPALLIGMDLLGTVRRLVIDYRHSEILIQPSGG